MKNNTPRRKSMKRPSRLQSAKHWIPTYTGKNIIKGYRKRFGVDISCAIKELKMLNVKLDEQYICRVLQTMEQRIASRKKQREQKESALNDEDFDDDFYYIDGYTSWGFPYGLTWREAEELQLLDEHYKDKE